MTSSPALDPAPLHADARAEHAAAQFEDAMSVYSVAARLVELQLAMVEQGAWTGGDLAASRDVLLGTRSMLMGALQAQPRTGVPAPAAFPARAALSVIDGGRAARS